MCCRLEFTVYDANRFTAKAISGHVKFVTYWSSPNNCAYELLQSPSFPFGFGIILICGLSGIWTVFASASSCFSRIYWIPFFCEIVILSEDWDISMPTIFYGSPKFVVFHSVYIFFFISSIVFTESAKRRTSFIQMVMITILSDSERVYTHGSTRSHLYSHRHIFVTNSVFHSWLDCLSP